PPAVAGNARGVDGIDVGTWMGRAWWKSLTAQWSLNSHRKSLPAGQFDTLLGDGRTMQTDTRGVIEVKFEPKINEQLSSLTRAHVNYYSYRGNFAHSPDQGGQENVKYDGGWTGVEQRVSFEPSKKVRLTAGGEGQVHYRVRQYGELETGTYLNDKDHTF